MQWSQVRGRSKPFHLRGNASVRHIGVTSRAGIDLANRIITLFGRLPSGALFHKNTVKDKIYMGEEIFRPQNLLQLIRGQV